MLHLEHWNALDNLLACVAARYLQFSCVFSLATAPGLPGTSWLVAGPWGFSSVHVLEVSALRPLDTSYGISELVGGDPCCLGALIETSYNVKLQGWRLDHFVPEVERWAFPRRFWC